MAGTAATAIPTTTRRKAPCFLGGRSSRAASAAVGRTFSRSDCSGGVGLTAPIPSPSSRRGIPTQLDGARPP